MQKILRSHLLLLAIFAASFFYRLFLMFRDVFPPGTDIGPHNGIIYTITQTGGDGVNFVWNNYHMGGGFSATFPGYHIFVAFLTMISGMPTYIVQGIVASLFSSLIVLAAFLITRNMWNSSAGLVVAFLVAFSRFDIEILMWGGYPNTVVLMLIPLAFYLLLQKKRFSNFTFLTATSLVCAAIFLTHLLSAAIFTTITLATIFLATAFVRKPDEPKTSIFSWFAPLILGVLAISPFLIQAIPEFLTANTALLTAGGVKDIQQAFLETRIVSPQLILPVIGLAFLFFLFAKYYQGKFVTTSAILLFSWLLIPALLTQCYLVGWFTDFPRFIYFFFLPLLVFIGLSFFYFANFLSDKISAVLLKVKFCKVCLNRMPRVISRHGRKCLIAIVLAVFIFVAFEEPLFALPSLGTNIQSYYQVADQALYDASQWALNNTAANAVFAADADFGWWFSGFALRPTICGADPQYLSNAREVALATPVKYLLDSDYVVDNGLIQVREDGGFIGRHNPEFLIKLNGSYFPYELYYFNSSETTIGFCGGESGIFRVSDLEVKEMHIQSNEHSAMISITYANDLLTFTQETTVYQGLMFANVTEIIEATNSSVNIVELKLVLHSQGSFLLGNDSYTVGMVDTGMGVIGQLIFAEKRPTVIVSAENKNALMTYHFNASKVTLSFYAGVYQYLNNSNDTSPQTQTSFIRELLTKNAETWQNKVCDLPLTIYDYKQTLQNQNISYVLVRDFSQIQRFEKDASFSLVYLNNKVAVFRVMQLGEC